MPGIPDLHFLTQRPKRWWPWIVAAVAGAVVVAVVLGLFVAGLNKLSAKEDHPEDVQVTGCTASTSGLLTGQVTAVNSSTSTTSYTITIRFTTVDGRKLATATSYLSMIAPGGTGRTQVIAVANGAAPGPVSCTVSSARRSAM